MSDFDLYILKKQIFTSSLESHIPRPSYGAKACSMIVLVEYETKLSPLTFFKVIFHLDWRSLPSRRSNMNLISSNQSQPRPWRQVPKCEIFLSFDSLQFYTIKAPWIGDFETTIKNLKTTFSCVIYPKSYCKFLPNGPQMKPWPIIGYWHRQNRVLRTRPEAGVLKKLGLAGLA